MAKKTYTPNAQRDLEKDLGAAKVLKEHLLTILPEDGLDPATLHDMVQGETSLLETIEKVVELIGQDEAFAAGIAKHISTLQARKSRLEKRVDTLRAMIFNAMDMLEDKRIDLPIATLVLKLTPAKVVVIDEAEIPARFFETPAPVLVKKPLGDELKARRAAFNDLESKHSDGRIPKEAMDAFLAAFPPIPGAELDNGSATIQITFS